MTFKKPSLSVSLTDAPSGFQIENHVSDIDNWAHVSVFPYLLRVLSTIFIKNLSSGHYLKIYQWSVDQNVRESSPKS